MNETTWRSARSRPWFWVLISSIVLVAGIASLFAILALTTGRSIPFLPAASGLITVMILLICLLLILVRHNRTPL
ncbi:hypothetical protein ACL9RL_06270 [Plantibacter sp. Mn2098]|uniref:hypothetical protein n=1 Tax=Plantibacter sp. Mn2098 TaxID=3395266 RepID=UPI003BEDCDFE